MKYILITISLAIYSGALASSTDSDEDKCRSYLKIKENRKRAHENLDCLKAANAGDDLAQHSVGMGYGFAGNKELEEKYYRLGANNRNIAAYLSLGHVLRKDRTWESIYWYQRFISTKADGYGYAAYLISNIFKELGDDAQSRYWQDICKSSPYKVCKN